MDEDPDVAEVQRDSSNYDDQALRNRWEDLLDLSLDVEVDEVDGHPAFADILTQLHPDEARILRLLAKDDAQAGRGTTVRRSVRLTPFREQFCAATLPRNTAEFEAVSNAAARPVDEVPPPTEEPEPGVT